MHHSSFYPGKKTLVYKKSKSYLRLVRFSKILFDHYMATGFEKIAENFEGLLFLSLEGKTDERV